MSRSPHHPEHAPSPHVDQPGRFTYRPAIDGLRALAVLGVLLYHGAQLTSDPVDLFPGGFLGVDLFMVLSGYLITTLLLLEWRGTKRIKLGSFYIRRARRLMPALLLVMAAVSVAFLLADTAGLGPSQVDDYAGDAAASLFYVANWRFALSGASYFEQYGGPSPLRHMWSLAIEEQFYLVWPLVLFGLLKVLKLSRRGVAIVLMVAVWASAVLMAVQFDPDEDPSRLYYGTDTRAQALLLGALVAVALVGVPGRRLATTKVQILGTVGLAGVLAAFVFATDDPGTTPWLYTGGFLAVAMVSAAAIIGASAEGNSAYLKVLSVKPLVWIGSISYGLYLWHWPVFVVLSSEKTGLGGPALLVLRLLVSFALAVASYKLVEAPIRFGALSRPRPRAIALSGGAAALALVLVAALTVKPEGGLLETLTDEEIAALDNGQGPVVEPGDTKVLLVGDSVAQSLGYYQGDSPGLAIKTAAIIGCGVARGSLVPIDRPPPPPREQCETWPERWQAAIQQFDPDVSVVQIGAWEIIDREVDGELLQVGTEEYADYLWSELELGHRILTQDGRPMVLLTSACFKVTKPGTPSDWAERDDTSRVDWLNSVLTDFAAAHDNVTLIDLHAKVCPDGTYVGELNGVELYEDGTHYTKDGAPVIWAWLTPQLKQFGPAQPAAAP